MAVSPSLSVLSKLTPAICLYDEFSFVMIKDVVHFFCLFVCVLPRETGGILRVM